MSRTKEPELSRLDEAAEGVESLSAELTFGPWRGSLETSYSEAGTRSFVLRFEVLAAEGGGVVETWTGRGRRLSSVLKSLARKHPGIVLPPTRLHLTGRGRGVSVPEIRSGLIAGLAEALGRPLPAAPAAAPVDWADVLRAGAEGVKRWAKLKASERKAAALSGADLSGLDLASASFRGITAKRANFAGAVLRGADLVGAIVDRADFSGADLRDARLTDLRAPEARLVSARIAGADLSDAMLFGASLAGADLARADLRGANLQKADLGGADLADANLDGATFNGQTAWPEGFSIPAEVLFVGRGTDPRLVGKGPNAEARDVRGLLARLHSLIDPKRMKRTIDMLKAGRNQIFAEVDPGAVRGIVRSQRDPDAYYSCVLAADGSYACCSPELSLCMGLAGEPCKHILVLLIGLARAGQIDPATVDRWVLAAHGKNQRWNKTTKNYVSDTLLRYKGVVAGEVDWRPTETIPEDFYS